MTKHKQAVSVPILRKARQEDNATQEEEVADFPTMFDEQLHEPEDHLPYVDILPRSVTR